MLKNHPLLSMKPMDINYSMLFLNILRHLLLPGFTSLRSFSNHHELYHESHQGVAVMFASIPHFYEFYDETDVSKQGLGCIALLNEIICDFDKLLLKNKFSRIEKIKTIGRLVNLFRTFDTTLYIYFMLIN